jgi:hypothetical protein
MSNSFVRGGQGESSNGTTVWSSAVYDDDDEAEDDGDFEEEDGTSVHRHDRWFSKPGFGSPEWWSGT